MVPHLDLKITLCIILSSVAQAAEPPLSPAAPDVSDDVVATFPGHGSALEHLPDCLLVRFKPRNATISTGRLRVVRLAPGSDVGLAVSEYSRRSNVQYAEPDYLLYPDATPNDARWSDQWGTRKIGSTAAWNLAIGTPTGRALPITVCVVDSGIDYRHPDLIPNLHPLVGYNAGSNNNDTMDTLRHGTHVAGILGASGNNSIGVAGVNWKVQLLSCKFIGSSGSGSTSNAIECIQYCVRQGARIIQASWSGGSGSAMRDAIQAAGNAGVLFVNSAGNDKLNIDVNASYPAAYNLPNMLVVAAATQTDSRSSYSNWGPTKVHLAAPGDNIMSTVPGDATAPAKYAYMTGTSMATPMVSGAAALVLAAAGGNLTMAQLRQILLDSVDPVAALQGKVLTGGRLNVYRALTSALATTTLDTSPDPESPPTDEVPLPDSSLSDPPPPPPSLSESPPPPSPPRPSPSESPLPESPPSPSPPPPSPSIGRKLLR